MGGWVFRDLSSVIRKKQLVRTSYICFFFNFLSKHRITFIGHKTNEKKNFFFLQKYFFLKLYPFRSTQGRVYFENGTHKRSSMLFTIVCYTYSMISVYLHKVAYDNLWNHILMWKTLYAEANNVFIIYLIKNFTKRLFCYICCTSHCCQQNPT